MPPLSKSKTVRVLHGMRLPCLAQGSLRSQVPDALSISDDSHRGLTSMSKQLHHVVMSSYSADTLIKFFNEVVGLETQHQFPVPGHVFETKPTFAENSKAWPIWADTTKMVDLLGPNRVSIREGVRRTIEAARDRLNTSHHVIGEPAKV